VPASVLFPYFIAKEGSASAVRSKGLKYVVRPSTMSLFSLFTYNSLNSLLCFQRSRNSDLNIRCGKLHSAEVLCIPYFTFCLPIYRAMDTMTKFQPSLIQMVSSRNASSNNCSLRLGDWNEGRRGEQRRN
jgi:hypothetical protein